MREHRAFWNPSAQECQSSVFTDRRRGMKDLWKGEMDKLLGWVSVVLLVFRPLGGRFVFVEDAS